MSKPICFYHSADLDGLCSGAIVLRNNPGCEMFGIDYGQELPWSKVKDRDVIMVDFHLEPHSDMHRLARECKSLVWVDHHASAIKDQDENPVDGDHVTCLTSIDFAACELTWAFYNQDEDLGLMPMETPGFVYLLGRYDIWDKTNGWDTKVLPFQYGLRRLANTVSSHVWQQLFDDYNDILLLNIIHEGKIILDAQRQFNSKICRRAFTTTVRGVKFIAINYPDSGSMVLDSVYDSEKHDGRLVFSNHKGKYWYVTMYSEKVDVSEIATYFGGGGHKGAAGFTCSKLPFIGAHPVFDNAVNRFGDNEADQ